MSIYATNFIVDEETGEAKLIKRLNKTKINRFTLRKQPGGWNKSGKKAIYNKEHNSRHKAEKTISRMKMLDSLNEDE